MQRIRTLSEVEFDFPIFTESPFKYQQLSQKAKKLRQLGMTYRAIGKALGVDDRLARKAVSFSKKNP